MRKVPNPSTLQYIQGFKETADMTHYSGANFTSVWFPWLNDQVGTIGPL
jgi:hypothetical protein